LDVRKHAPSPVHTPAVTAVFSHFVKVAFSPASVPTRGDQPRLFVAAEQSNEAGAVIDRTL
jgi:hypothetical protein